MRDPSVGRSACYAESKIYQPEGLPMTTVKTNNTTQPVGLGAITGPGRIGAATGTDSEWPANLMCRLLLPVPVKELAAISAAFAKIARKQGKEARMKQVGQTLEIFTA